MANHINRFQRQVRFVGLVLLVLFASPIGEAQPPTRQDNIRVVIAAVLNTSDPRFPNVDKQEVRDQTAKTASERLRKALLAAKYDVPSEEDVVAAERKLQLDFTKPKDRGKIALAKLGKELQAGFVVLVWITDVSQQNFETSAVLNNLSGPASSTKAHAKVWLMDVPGGSMIVEGRAFEGEAKGPHFGTTRRGELSGNPQDVAAAINQENKRRAEWMGRAAMAAVDAAIGGTLGLRLISSLS